VKIFLTGGTGYLGSGLREALLAAGHDVTVLARKPGEEGGNSRLQWVKGDLLDGVESSLLNQHSVVLHSAAMVATWHRDRSLFDRVNVEAYDGLLEACSRSGVTKIIHTSSFMSLGPSPTATPIDEGDRTTREHFYTDYERTKYLADAVTDRWLEKGLGIVTLYPTVLYGPGACTDGNLIGKMLYWVREGKFPGMVGDGDQVWNYAYVPDVIAGHVAAVERGLAGQRFVLGGENVGQKDMLEQLHTVLGRPARFRKIPIRVAEWMGQMMEFGARFTGNAPDLTRGVAGIYREHWAYSSKRAERSLGYRITPIADALSSTASWVQELDAWE